MLLATEDADVLFVIGSDDAQVHFYPDFDHIVLLSAPRDVMVERLATRTNNPFGKTSDELAKILADLETYEPLMRRDATHEIDTSQPLDRVIDEIPQPDLAATGTMRRCVGSVTSRGCGVVDEVPHALGRPREVEAEVRAEEARRPLPSSRASSLRCGV